MNCCGLNQLVVSSVAIIKTNQLDRHSGVQMCWILKHPKFQRLPKQPVENCPAMDTCKCLATIGVQCAVHLLLYPVPIQSRTNVTPVASMLFDQIKNYLVETAGVDPQQFENPELKIADLELDSLGLIEMLFEVEDKYGFQIPDPMVFLPMTFAGMVTAIEAMVQEHTKLQTALN